MRRSLVFLLIGMSTVPAVADAQTVIMRKPIGDVVFGSGAGGYQKPDGTVTPTPTPVPTPVSGSWTTSAAKAIAPSCSATAPASRDVWCAGPDGARLPDAGCATQGAKPAATTTIADWSGCGYAWQPVGTTSWSSTCSDRAVATRSYVCQRQDGEAVAAPNCDTSHRETETEMAANLTTCTYEPAYSTTYGNCVGGTQTAPIASCARSDGKDVPVSECGATRQTTERTCAATRQTCGTSIEGRRWDIASGSNYTAEPVKIITAPTRATRLALARDYCETAVPKDTKNTQLVVCRLYEPTGASINYLQAYLVWGDGTPIKTTITSNSQFSYATCVSN